MDFPLISVIIPVKDRPAFLREAIYSVLNQTYNNLELIVVDDGSKVSASNIIYNFKDKRIKYIYIKNFGVSKARNIGVKLSKTDWICFLDSDDIWKRKKLERQIDCINNDATLIYTDEEWIKNGKHLNQSKKHKKYSGLIYDKCLNLCIISASSAMLRKDIFIQFGGFDEELIVCEDYDLWLKWTSKYPVIFINEKLIVKRGGHPDQLSKKYPAMDTYRIKSLKNIIYTLSNEKYKNMTYDKLFKKLIIVLGGAIKRHNWRLVKENISIYKEINENILNINNTEYLTINLLKILTDKYNIKDNTIKTKILPQLIDNISGKKINIYYKVLKKFDSNSNIFGMLKSKKINIWSIYLLSRINKKHRDVLLKYILNNNLTFSENRIIIETFYDYKNGSERENLLKYLVGDGGSVSKRLKSWELRVKELIRKQDARSKIKYRSQKTEYRSKIQEAR